MQQQRENRKSDRPFAEGLGFYKLFWIFFIGCVLGVIIETIWCLVTSHQIECRAGVIYGPFNPVYGFGAVFMTVCLYWLREKRDAWIFFGGAIVGGVCEYVCSWGQELLFGTISWNYTDQRFNLQGRTSLMFMFFWGVLAVLWIKGLYPWLSRQIERIPRRWGVPLSWVLAVLLAIDCAISGLAVARQADRHQGIAPRNAVEEFLDEHYTDALLKIIYPNMIIVEE